MGSIIWQLTVIKCVDVVDLNSSGPGIPAEAHDPGLVILGLEYTYHDCYNNGQDDQTHHQSRHRVTVNRNQVIDCVLFEVLLNSL